MSDCYRKHMQLYFVLLQIKDGTSIEDENDNQIKYIYVHESFDKKLKYQEWLEQSLYQNELHK